MIKGITHILENDVTVQGLLGLNLAGTKHKIYPVVCPQPEQTPYAVCRMTGKVRQYKGGTVYVCAFTVASFHRNMDDVEVIDDAILNALDNVKGTYNGITFGYIIHTDTKDDYVDTEGGLYSKISTFECSMQKVV